MLFAVYLVNLRGDQAPPKGQVAGSSPAGVTILSQDVDNLGHGLAHPVPRRGGASKFTMRADGGQKKTLRVDLLMRQGKGQLTGARSA